jgi:hypothetical protein
MHAPSAANLLGAWERGLRELPACRPLALLTTAYPQTDPSELAELSLGRRDGELLALRESLFGREVAALAVCPGCGERLDLTFSTETLRDTTVGEPEATRLSLQAGGYDISFRPLNTLDLAAVRGDDPAADRRRLFACCLLQASLADRPCTADELPEVVVGAVADRLAEADPRADLRLGLACPECEHRWEAALDLASFIWDEVDAWAPRLLREVHLIAGAYGWSEADILALSPTRRRLYLELIGG